MPGPDLRAREPEGRRRQDDDRGQPRRLPGRGRRARARHRPRPAGERDLGARRARERQSPATTCSTARRSTSSRSRRASPNLDLVPAKPELAGAVVELARASRRRALPRRGARGRARALRLRLPRLPAVARPADRERARRRRPRARAGAGRVLRARGAVAAAAARSTLVSARLNPRLALGGVLLTMVDGRTRLAADVEDEVRRHFGELVFRTVVPRSVRLAEAPSHGLPVIAYDRRSRRRRGLLEGGDGACRARLTRSRPRPRPRPRGADRRRGGEPELAAPARSRRSTRTRASRAAASTREATRGPRRLDPHPGRAPAGRRAPARRAAATS